MGEPEPIGKGSIITVERIGLAILLAFQIGGWSDKRLSAEAALEAQIARIERAGDEQTKEAAAIYVRKDTLERDFNAINERLGRIEKLLESQAPRRR